MKTMSALGITCAVLCTGCLQNSAPPLTFDEVMKNAALASQNFASANLTVALQADLATKAGQFAIQANTEGAMDNAGAKFMLEGTVAVNGVASGVPLQSSIDGEIVKDTNGAVFLKINSLVIEPEVVLQSLGLQNVEAVWQQIIPASSGSSTTSSSLPLSPTQLDVFTLLQEQYTNGTFRYDIQIDERKLLSALQSDSEQSNSSLINFAQNHSISGTIWIDEVTYFTKQLHWQIVPKNQSGERYTIDIQVEFSDINLPQNILIPENPLLLESGSTL